jgi:hypothetical protein
VAKAASISLSKLTAAVQAAVKSAMVKHPKFKLATPEGITVSYMIRGVELPDTLATSLTLAESQAFADEVASQIEAAQPEAMERVATASVSGGKGAVVSLGGGPVVVGFLPAISPVLVGE